MVKIIKMLIIMGAIAFSLFGCLSTTSDNAKGEGSSASSGEVKFCLESVSSMSASIQSDSEHEIPASVALEYSTVDGSQTVSKTIELTTFGSGYITKNVISLNEGEYDLTRFDVLNDSGLTIYSTPTANSPVATSVGVKTGLTYRFAVTEGEISTFDMQVIKVDDDTDPADFGHAAFTFEVVGYNRLYIDVMTLIDSVGWSYVPAELSIADETGTEIKKIELNAVINKVILPNDENYTLTISKSGYASQTITLAQAQIEQYSTQPLVLKLSKECLDSWTKGCNENETFGTITTDKEGNSLFGVYSKSSSFIRKLNKNGTELNEKELPDNFKVFNILQTEDEGFILAGTIEKSSFVMKLNNDFDILWEKSYPVNNYYTNIAEDNNNQLVLTGAKYTSSSNDYHILGSIVDLLTEEGELIWHKEIITKRCTSSDDIKVLDNGSFLVLLHYSNGYTDDDSYCYELDSTGSILSSIKLTSNSAQEMSFSMEEVKDGYIFVGRIDYSVSKIKVFKTNKSLEKIWQKEYTGPASRYICHSVSSTIVKDGRLVVASAYNNVLRILNIDLDGNLIFEKSITKDIIMGASFNCVSATSDGGFIVSTSNSLFKFNKNGNCPELEELK